MKLKRNCICLCFIHTCQSDVQTLSTKLYGSQCLITFLLTSITRTKKALKEALNRNYHHDDEGNGFEMINYSFCKDEKCCVLYFIENLG